MDDVPLRLFSNSEAAWAYFNSLEHPPKELLWEASLDSADSICVVEFIGGTPVDWGGRDVPWSC